MAYLINLVVIYKFPHNKLPNLLQKAYSAEKAAAFAYLGHAGSVKDKVQSGAIRQIELDEWNHRHEVRCIMQLYDIPVSRWFEFRFHITGRVISWRCYAIGWFMPFYFAGSLESGNVCDYFRMMQYFHALGIKKHEIYFLDKIKNNKLLPFFFKKFFAWGGQKSFNDVNLDEKYPVDSSDAYCRNGVQK